MARKSSKSSSSPQANAIAEEFLAAVHAVHSSGANVPETSFYPAISNLFNAIGATLSPKVKCLINLANRGAGIPDGGLFTADQFPKRGDPDALEGLLPARGAIEVKSPTQDAEKTANDPQVAKYAAKYGIVIVTNLREFLIVERSASGSVVIRERYSLAATAKDFWQKVAAHPRAFQQAHGAEFIEFLQRACLHAAPLVDPKDVAWLLASYARDALARVDRHKDLPALQSVRDGMEEALGMKFAGEKGDHFFRSTLVQTIFYGVFSSWVLWHRQNPDQSRFDWRTAGWSLHVPFIRTLYDQLATPQRLGNLGLVEVLDWTAAVLNRVQRSEFFGRFQEDKAVQYFYEPFLAAFDPELRKDLGVWYTPEEIVKYQVARVDTVLREELAIPDGLADPRVIVLDPCCGTGAYLVAVLNKIAETLAEKGDDGLLAADLKRAATERVFGFEILPAPFVVAHLQLGLLLQEKGAPLKDEKNERVGVYLTNALTGWEPPKGPKAKVAFPELEVERDAAESVKRDKRILVILGNPPYNAFAGISPEEEGDLVAPYKVGLNKPEYEGGWGIKKFNLDDLYVRFFRIAERRISEMSGTGVVSFISNHSWVSEPSFVVLRQSLLASFDKFWIENLHGNRKISEYAPDGRTSETIFATPGFSSGIQQGVATSLWVKTGKKRKSGATVRFRDDIDSAKADERRALLLESVGKKRFNESFKTAAPTPQNRFSFRPESVSDLYRSWPKLTDLCRVPPENGLMEKRGGSLIDIDRDALAERMKDYFDSDLSWDDYKRMHTGLTEEASGFEPRAVRKKALDADSFDEKRVTRYALRPFDTRWCYHTSINPIWNRARPVLYQQVQDGTSFLLSRPGGVANPEGAPMSFTRCLGDNDYQRGHAYYFARYARVQEDKAVGMFQQSVKLRANLSTLARDHLKALKLPDPDSDATTGGLIWEHALAIGYSTAYLTENADGIRGDWPRIPMPPKKSLLLASAKLGERVAALLDTEKDVAGVTSGKLGAMFRTVGAATRDDGKAIAVDGDDLRITAGWGRDGGDGKVMPGRGRTESRARNDDEREALALEAKAIGFTAAHAEGLLGAETLDVYLNGSVAWRNVPANVWEYHIGGYQVVKKWLSYREASILGRPLKPEEVREVTAMIRRLTALVLMGPELDANYKACAG